MSHSRISITMGESIREGARRPPWGLWHIFKDPEGRQPLNDTPRTSVPCLGLHPWVLASSAPKSGRESPSACLRAGLPVAWCQVVLSSHGQGPSGFPGTDAEPI